MTDEPLENMGPYQPTAGDKLRHLWLRRRDGLRNIFPSVFKKKEGQESVRLIEHDVHTAADLAVASKEIHKEIMSVVKSCRREVLMYLLAAIFFATLATTAMNHGNWEAAIPDLAMLSLYGWLIARAIRQLEQIAQQHGQFHAVVEYVGRMLPPE